MTIIVNTEHCTQCILLYGLSVYSYNINIIK